MTEKTDLQSIIPPIARKEPKELEKHGHIRIDDYYWLNDRENHEVISYLAAENTYTEEMMKPTEALQAKLFEEIKGRVKQNDMSVPYNLRGYSYYTRFEEGQEYPVYCRKKLSKDAQDVLIPTGEEAIIMDVNLMAEGHNFYSLGGISISDNNILAAYFVDTVGRRQYTLHFKNLETGEISEDIIPDVAGFAWAGDNKTLFYGKKDTQTLRPYQVYRHTLGTDYQKDTLVYEEKDETFNASVYRSKSREYIIIGTFSTLSSEYYFAEAGNPMAEFKLFQAREDEHEYFIDHYADKFYVRTNWDAKNFRLMQTSIEQTEKENWQEIIAHRSDVLLEGIDIFKNYLALSERVQGLTALRIRPWNGDKEHYLNFGEPTYTAYTSSNPEFDTPILRYGYTSMTTPNSVYDYDMHTQEKTLLKQQEVVGGYNSEDYQAERLFATAQDGTKIPMSVVYKKGLTKEGKNPLLLYGYGSYGNSLDAYFSTVRLSLLDRGFVFVIAHIRGGEEMGREWYENGKMFQKKNTFTDFIACAEYLITEKFTSPEYLFAEGGSAGGLLMGAIMNMRPELFKGIISQVPFVDVVTTMLDESIPLTTGEYDEWGNPNNKDSYEYMLSYSPYDQVEVKAYPHMLVTTGLHDSQVQYWEPAKWVAKLRDMKTDDNRLLLKTDMEAGHGGKTGRFKQFYDIAFEYAFFLHLLGINE
jgi:oligopeptidase B